MNSNIFEKVIDVAKSLEFAPQSRFKHFSFLVRRNRICSIGWNISQKTHTVANKHNHRYSSLHSELCCIKHFKGWPSELYRYTMVNIRLGGNSELRMAKPCKPCVNMLEAFQIKDIWFSNQKGQLERFK